MALHDVGPTQVGEDMLKACAAEFGTTVEACSKYGVTTAVVDAFAKKFALGVLRYRDLADILSGRRKAAHERNILYLSRGEPEGHFIYLRLPDAILKAEEKSLQIVAEALVTRSRCSISTETGREEAPTSPHAASETGEEAPTSPRAATPVLASEAQTNRRSPSTSGAVAHLDKWEYRVFSVKSSTAETDLTHGLETLGARCCEGGFTSDDTRQGVATYVAGFVVTRLQQGNRVLGVPSDEALRLWWQTAGEHAVGKEQAPVYENSMRLQLYTPLPGSGLDAIVQQAVKAPLVSVRKIRYVVGNCPVTALRAIFSGNVARSVLLVEAVSGKRTASHFFVIEVAPARSPARPEKKTMVVMKEGMLVPERPLTSKRPLHTLTGVACFEPVGDGLMICKICKQALINDLVVKKPPRLEFAKGGVKIPTGSAGEKKRSDHEKSEFHVAAKEALLAPLLPCDRLLQTHALRKMQTTKPAPLPKKSPAALPSIPAEDVALYNLHARMYVGVKNGLSHSAMIKELAGERLQHVSLEARYNNRTALRELIGIWSELLLNRFRQQLLAEGPENLSPLFLVVDASTMPHAGDDVVGVRVRYADASEPSLLKETFIGLVPNVPKGSDNASATGDATYKAVTKLLNPLSVSMSDIYGWCSDDGATMIGRNEGVIALIAKNSGRKKKGIAKALDAAHLLQTKLKFVLEDPAVKQITSTVRSVNRIFKSSTLMRRTLREACSEAGKTALKPDGSWRIRWLKKWATSMTKASRMRDAWAKCLSMESVVRRAQKKGKSEKRQKVTKKRLRISKKLCEEKFVTGLRYLSQLFGALACPQLIGQLEAGQASQIAAYLQKAQLALAVMNVPDAYLSVHHRAISLLVPETVMSANVLDAVTVLDVGLLKERLVDTDYGESAWTRMCELAYPNDKEHSALLKDWGKVKEAARSTKLLFLDFWRARLVELSDQGSRAARVLQVTLCTGCASSCGVERDFGEMRWRVSELRNRVEVETISQEMLISKNGPPPADAHDFLMDGIRFWNVKDRRDCGGRPKKETDSEAERNRKTWTWVEAMHRRGQDPAVQRTVDELRERDLAHWLGVKGLRGNIAIASIVAVLLTARVAGPTGQQPVARPSITPSAVSRSRVTPDANAATSSPGQQPKARSTPSAGARSRVAPAANAATSSPANTAQSRPATSRPRGSTSASAAPSAVAAPSQPASALPIELPVVTASAKRKQTHQPDTLRTHKRLRTTSATQPAPSTTDKRSSAAVPAVPQGKRKRASSCPPSCPPPKAIKRSNVSSSSSSSSSASSSCSSSSSSSSS
ncbi:hypothetical protein DIPPA_16902 [Diplonema papillatum]|nr:hypothetical protein DIPPA_16902 [Diplonema papillatum]